MVRGTPKTVANEDKDSSLGGKEVGGPKSVLQRLKPDFQFGAYGRGKPVPLIKAEN
jgi:hypothetical protein